LVLPLRPLLENGTKSCAIESGCGLKIKPSASKKLKKSFQKVWWCKSGVCTFAAPNEKKTK
jgi:hypothetical protein